MSRILFIEDDPAILCGLTICDNSPERVILDLMLPKLNGYDLCRRARGEGFSSPILMLSARSVEADRVLDLDLGANDYVTKPFSRRELLWRGSARCCVMSRSTMLIRNASKKRSEWRRGCSKSCSRASLPAVDGIDYTGVCRPARGVSGDYYDFLALGPEKLGLLLADVSGKGISAALLGASLHAAVRAHAPGAGERCGELIARISGVLFETSTPDRFATCFTESTTPRRGC